MDGDSNTTFNGHAQAGLFQHAACGAATQVLRRLQGYASTGAHVANVIDYLYPVLGFHVSLSDANWREVNADMLYAIVIRGPRTNSRAS